MRVLGKYAVAAILVVVLVLVAIMPAQAQGQVHTVQRGETMWSIATRYGTTVDAIARANGLANPRFIYAGQRLTVPLGGGGGAGTAATGGTYTVRRGDTLSSIASRHGTTVNALVQANGLRNPSYIYAGQRLVIRGGGGSAPATGQAASAGGATYTVRRGDTLSSIASRHGTTASAIARVNGLANPSYIYVGQRLSIPSGGGQRRQSQRGVASASSWIYLTSACTSIRMGSCCGTGWSPPGGPDSRPSRAATRC